MFGAIAGVLGAGLKIWGDQKKREAEKKAFEIQRKAIESLKGIDVGKAERTIAQKDIEHYNRSLDFFRQKNPELARAREEAMSGFEKSVGEAAGFFDEQKKLFQQQVAEAAPDPIVDDIRRTLMEQTQANLKRGAQLPPEFQAELVKAGLEADVSGSRQGTLATRLGTTLGAAGIELEAKRRQEAAMALQLDQALTQARQGILGNLVSQAAAIPAGQAQFYSTANEVTNAMVPNIGLKGMDVFQLEEANRALENEKIMKIADLRAKDRLSMGNRDTSMINRGAELLSSLSGGGAAGALGGLFGGFGKTTVSSPEFGTVSASKFGGPATFSRTNEQQAAFLRAQALYE